MIQLAYISSTRGFLTAEDIAELLVGSREKNHRLGITGMLLYKGGNVLQILEGETEQVTALFEVIQKDERHSGVIKLYQRNIAERDFPEWTMGFHDLNADDARNLEGYSEFLDPNFDVLTLTPSTAARLLNSFKSGIR